MNRITFRSLMAVPVLLVLLCVPSVASADGITWTLSGVTFDDGGTATGSFVFDATTATVISAAIVTAGGTHPGNTYTGMNMGSTDISDPLAEIVFLPDPSLADLTGTPALDLVFFSDLTNSGGTFALVGNSLGGGEVNCGDAKCTFADTAIRLIAAGEVVSPVVTTPEPSTFLLVGMGLVALLAGATIRKISYA
jgi:hypothetical protein